MYGRNAIRYIYEAIEGRSNHDFRAMMNRSPDCNNMPSTRRRSARLQAAALSRPRPVPVTDNGPSDAEPGQSPAAEPEIHAPSVEESTQRATALLVETPTEPTRRAASRSAQTVEESAKKASTRPADNSGESTQLNTNTPVQTVEESTQLASSRRLEGREESTQRLTNSSLQFIAAPDALDKDGTAKTDGSQTNKRDAHALGQVTRLLLSNAALSLPDARLVIAYTRYSIPEDAQKDSAMVCLRKIPGRGDMFGVVQTSAQADFTISFPYCPRPIDERSKRSARSQLDCKVLYDPTSDNCLLLNKTNKNIYLTDLNHQATRTCVAPKQGCIVRPGIWTISVDTGERDRFTENRLVEFLLLGRRFTVSIHGVTKPPPSEQAAVDQAGDDGRAPKRQKLGDGGTTSRVAKIPDSFLKQTKYLSAPRQVVNSTVVPILDLTDGETALIEAPEINITDARGTYRLLRVKGISRTQAAGVFTCQRSGESETVVVKILCYRNNPAMFDLKHTLQMWMLEKTILEGLEHRNIVSLKGADARFFAIYLEHLPSSLRRDPQSQSIALSSARTILYDISSALAYMARRGIVHHDIKPANITYSANRGAVLIDFGMAGSPADAKSRGGTPHYFPPEYLEDETRGYPGDVWALGVTMLYMLGKLAANALRSLIDLPQLLDETSQSRALFKYLQQTIASQRKKLDRENMVENLVFQMLEPDVEERVSAAEIESVLKSSHTLAGGEQR
ncbi:kinase-like domain-containing protein [Trichoderma novae-zelandiae]